MQAALIKMALATVSKLMTQAFFEEVMLTALKRISQATTNKVDDQVYRSIERALGK